MGRVDAQQVVEGGGGINKCRAGGITVLYWWLSLFLSLCSSGFQDLLRLNPPSLLILFGRISISMAIEIEMRPNTA